MVFTAEVSFRVGVDTVCVVVVHFPHHRAAERGPGNHSFWILHTYKIEQIGHDIFIPTIEELLKKSSLKRCSLGED